jgi:hypothetical protein
LILRPLGYEPSLALSGIDLDVRSRRRRGPRRLLAAGRLRNGISRNRADLGHGAQASHSEPDGPLQGLASPAPATHQEVAAQQKYGEGLPMESEVSRS